MEKRCREGAKGREKTRKRERERGTHGNSGEHGAKAQGWKSAVASAGCRSI